MSNPKGFTVWFTGLPSAGKSTLAELLAPELRRRGRGVEVFDGDVVRTHLCKGLGFSKEDRDENIRRIGFVCAMVTRHGGAAIAAAISPYRAIREEVRGKVENFVEVYVKTAVETCIQRDVKGLYKKALAGEIKGFTGVDDPYEAPANPELIIVTEEETPQESAARIVRKLEELGYLAAEPAQQLSAEEEKRMRQRLVRLGYLPS
ncbi:MAG: adenylyl-sulfate kinase [Acidobacteriia bacterium]|nr:adenylyl-sulfate kinase [Terriglobia bacterium]